MPRRGWMTRGVICETTDPPDSVNDVAVEPVAARLEEQVEVAVARDAAPVPVWMIRTGIVIAFSSPGPAWSCVHAGEGDAGQELAVLVDGEGVDAQVVVFPWPTIPALTR